MTSYLITINPAHSLKWLENQLASCTVGFTPCLKNILSHDQMFVYASHNFELQRINLNLQSPIMPSNNSFLELNFP